MITRAALIVPAMFTPTFTMAGTFDKLIAAHIKALQEMGVKIVGDAPKKGKPEDSAKTKALEDLLK